MPRWRQNFLAGFAVALCLVGELNAQEMVSPEQAGHVIQLFDDDVKTNDLRCKVQAWGPSLGFDLNYRAGFFVELDSTQLAVNSNLDAFLRVTPTGRSPALLSTVSKRLVRRTARGGSVLILYSQVILELEKAAMMLNFC